MFQGEVIRGMRGSVYIPESRLIFLYFSAGWVSQGTREVTHAAPFVRVSPVALLRPRPPLPFALALSLSRSFFFIASRASCMYRIRSTVNAFIKPRKRYASGNERAMGARVAFVQWRNYTSFVVP